MKQGTGEDPFADEPAADDTEVASPPPTPTDSVEDTDIDAQAATDADEDEVAWAVRRSSVKSDREMHPFYAQESTIQREKEVKQIVEEQLGYDVYLTDFREAAHLEGLSNPAGIAEVLEDWGCKYA